MRIVFALAFLAAACGATFNNVSPPQPVQEEVALLWTSDTRAVLDGETALALARQCSRVSPGPVEGQWSPSEAEIDALEDGLIHLLAERLEQAGQSPSPGGYYRQYAGFIIGGARVIYANGFDEDLLAHGQMPWREQPVSICDGGTITFGVEYRPDTRAFQNFAFNGHY